MKLCCFFNYAPLYRESVYCAIDRAFDTQFYFGEEVIDREKSGIAKLDYSVFTRQPIEFKNKILFGKILWRTKSATLAFHRYDTFLITGDFCYSYIPLLILCRLFGKRVYGWGHGLKQKSSALKFFYSFMYKSLSGFFTYGEGGKKRLVELGVPSDKIRVIYNSLNAGVNATENRTLQSEIYKEHFNNSNPTLIFMGRLTMQKKLDWLLRLIKSLKSTDNECNLMIIGDGPCGTSLKKLSESLNIEENCWFFGECYDEHRLNEFIFNADVCVSPGNVGLTALHALTYGVPVISHDDFETQMPEYEVIEPGKTGALYEKGNFEDFVSTVRSWLKGSAARNEIRQNCYDIINGKWNSKHQIEILKFVLIPNGK